MRVMKKISSVLSYDTVFRSFEKKLKRARAKGFVRSVRPQCLHCRVVWGNGFTHSKEEESKFLSGLHPVHVGRRTYRIPPVTYP